jgi:hypothetical protein
MTTLRLKKYVCKSFLSADPKENKNLNIQSIWSVVSKYKRAGLRSWFMCCKTVYIHITTVIYFNNSILYIILKTAGKETRTRENG